MTNRLAEISESIERSRQLIAPSKTNNFLTGHRGSTPNGPGIDPEQKLFAYQNVLHAAIRTSTSRMVNLDLKPNQTKLPLHMVPMSALAEPPKLERIDDDDETDSENPNVVTEQQQQQSPNLSPQKKSEPLRMKRKRFVDDKEDALVDRQE